VYQLGRGRAPVVVVKSALSLVAVNTKSLPNPLITLDWTS
jgi:hypothetical protein